MPWAYDERDEGCIEYTMPHHIQILRKRYKAKQNRKYIKKTNKLNFNDEINFKSISTMESPRKVKTVNKLIITYRKSIKRKYRNSSRTTTSDFLDDDQRNAHLLYFTNIYYIPLHVSSIICSSSGG